MSCAPHDKKYVQQDAPAGDAISAVLSQARGTLLPTLAGNPQMLSRLFSQPGLTAALGTPQTVAGVATDTVVFTLPGPGGGQNQITLSVATADHLLRRVSETVKFTSGGKPVTFSHTETVTEQTTGRRPDRRRLCLHAAARREKSGALWSRRCLTRASNPAPARLRLRPKT